MAEQTRQGVCTCGHTAHWHAAVIVSDGNIASEVPQGEGECEASDKCDCKRFDLDHVDTLNSLRARIAELEASQR